MKYLTQYMTMLKVAELIAAMPSGGGWTVASDYVHWSGLARATVYRRLKQMVKHDLLIMRETKKGKNTYREYKLSDNGKALFAAQKPIFNWS